MRFSDSSAPTPQTTGGGTQRLFQVMHMQQLQNYDDDDYDANDERLGSGHRFHSLWPGGAGLSTQPIKLSMLHDHGDDYDEFSALHLASKKTVACNADDGNTQRKSVQFQSPETREEENRLRLLVASSWSDDESQSVLAEERSSSLSQAQDNVVAYRRLLHQAAGGIRRHSARQGPMASYALSVGALALCLLVAVQLGHVYTR